MNQPLAWSHTALADFVNCPKAFYEKRVIKSVKEEGSEQLVWGNHVHKAFELYVRDEKTLPENLAAHKNFLDSLRRSGDERYTEKKAALDKRVQSCAFFDKNVWWRGVIDYHCLQGSVAQVVDYKTGKRKNDFDQLKIFAIWIFATYPHVQTVKVSFYWTPTRELDSEIYHRDQIPEMWKTFTPNLRQYMSSFKNDVWPPRQSGLCNGWCPVTSCEFWKPKRR